MDTGAPRAQTSLEGVAFARAVLAAVALVLTFVTLYASFWILVGGLGLGKSKAPVVLPMLVGFGATQLVKPVLPSRGQILDGAVKLPVASLQRYFRREVLAAALGLAAGIGVLAVHPGALVPVRSELREVQMTGAGTATLQFERRFEEAPKLAGGLLASLVVVALGTAFAAARGAHAAWALRDVVRGMSEP